MCTLSSKKPVSHISHLLVHLVVSKLNCIQPTVCFSSGDGWPPECPDLSKCVTTPIHSVLKFWIQSSDSRASWPNWILRSCIWTTHIASLRTRRWRKTVAFTRWTTTFLLLSVIPRWGSMGDDMRAKCSHWLKHTCSVKSCKALVNACNLSLHQHHADFPKICLLFKLLWRRLSIPSKSLTSAVSIT